MQADKSAIYETFIVQSLSGVILQSDIIYRLAIRDLLAS